MLLASSSRYSTEQRSLLRPDLVGANRRDEEGGPLVVDDSVVTGNTSDLFEAFGTLSLAEDGEAFRFFGPTADSQCLLMTDNKVEGSATDSARDSKSPELPHDLEVFSQAFPFNPRTSGLTVRKIIQTYLLSRERAEYLVKTYLEQAGWFFRSVTPEQIMGENFPEYYHTHIPTDDKPHQLALLFVVFAIGALVDLNQAPGNTEAERFDRVARAAMCLRSVIERPSFETIQALHLLSIYNAMSGNESAGRETSMETTWSLVSLAAHPSHTLGPHRDSARWDLPPKEVERRRVLFWDLFVLDSWNSLDSGRPPNFNEAYVDCKYPQNPTEHDRGETGKQQLHEWWTMRFARECVAKVSACTLTTDSPSYPTIMELDRKVRGFSIPEPAANSLLLPLAIIEDPGNPLNSTYSDSFLAAYRASTTIVHTFKAQFNAHEGLICRFWPIWTTASAMKELHDACTLFSKGAKYSRRTQKALPIATKMSEKAHNALILAQSELPYELGQQRTMKKEDEDTDEVAIFRGADQTVPEEQQQQQSVDQTMSHSYSSDSSGTGWTCSEETQSAPVVPLPLTQHSSVAQIQAQRRQWPVDTSDPCTTRTCNATTSCQTSPRLHRLCTIPTSYYDLGSIHTHRHQNSLPSQTQHYDQPPNIPPLASSTAPTSYYELGSIHAHHHQNSVPSLHQYHEPTQQLPPIALAPPELAQLGLVSQESRLDQQWTSFMRQSGCFEDFGYTS
ncbi:hypothetical protein SCLCIDRAFT_26905 [Scleroderma citrinum Foug A]|uniref:Xylanolytic transcriptional activator regulatory domain-containing protein n=1 Tax=Scleroderma citrinum Foug A TaxID=1036808 RepID=A0A0C3DVH1_9AGAM|nr:hypothetical protein SCLCIDRAFT_26905 [Scleroderma citrinum Foug A]